MPLILEKRNTKPFWAIIALIVCLIGMQVTAIVMLSKISGTLSMASVSQSLLVRGSLTVVILLAEAVIYRILRYKLDRPQWVWTHIATLYFMIIAIPILIIIFNVYIVDQVSSGDAFEWARKANLIRNILFWSALVVGHFFFVLTIVRGFSKKDNLEINESTDLFDEFTP